MSRGNAKLEVGQLVLTSSTPTGNLGLYAKDENTIGVVGDLVCIDPKSKAESSVVTSIVDPVTGGIEKFQAGDAFSPTKQLWQASRRSTMAIIGDSFAVGAGSVFSASWSGVYSPSSPAAWMMAMLGARFQIIFAQGEAGTLPRTWINNGSLAAALATNPDYLFVTGDGDHGYASLSDFSSAYSEIFAAANKIGCIPIAHVIPPNNALSSAQERLNVQVNNEWLVNVAPTLYEVIVINVAGASLSRASNLFLPDLTVTDGVHWKCGGAFGAAALMAEELDNVIPRAPIPWLDMYESGTTRTGTIQSPNMIGSSGSVSVLTTTTGVPDGWAANADAGQSGTVNTSPRMDGAPGNWLDFDVTFTAINKVAHARAATGKKGTLAAGVDSVEFFAEIKMDETTLQVVNFPYFYVKFTGTANSYAASFNPGNTSSLPLGNTLVKNKYTRGVLTLSTGRVPIPAGTTGFDIYVGMQSAGAGNCKFSVGRVTFI